MAWIGIDVVVVCKVFQEVVRKVHTHNPKTCAFVVHRQVVIQWDLQLPAFGARWRQLSWLHKELNMYMYNMYNMYMYMLYM